ncbi:Protein of unknown function [Pyronema omphalodes CBS 100304]|uniref:Uncharacterized protein n=1 Tax=Pyronema omphalodes (strain CBS 100304) TaxID=1076935 RepID=U4LRU0_PYROM|nr:Protein of unknown function [Pyronema omphalodes CBS 100304]
MMHITFCIPPASHATPYFSC